MSDVNLFLHYAYTAIGFVSLISIFVVLTPLLFKRLRRLFFLRILAIISFLDFITAISLVMNAGRSPHADNLSDNKLCRVQAVIYTFSTRASYSWVCGLSIQLYSMISYAKPYFSEISMHAIFWSIPIFVEIIPLFAGVSYGMDDVDKEEAVETCFNRLGHLTSGKTVALIFGNQLYFYIGMIVLLVMCRRTNKIIQAKSKLANGTFDELCEVAKVMRLYPTSTIILYLPAFIYMLIVYVLGVRAYNVIADSVFGVSVSLFGIANTIIYFSNSQQAREEWKTLVLGKKKIILEEEVFDLSRVIVDTTLLEIMDGDIVYNPDEDHGEGSINRVGSKDDQVLVGRKSGVLQLNPLFDNSLQVPINSLSPGSL